LLKIKELINKIKQEEIRSLFNIEEIGEDGIIYINNMAIRVFQILPISIINISEEHKQKIVFAYLNFLKKTREKIQICIKTSASVLKESREEYLQVFENTKNMNLKKALSSYLEYLSRISEKEMVYLKEYYIVMRIDKENTIEEYMERFNELREIGLGVNNIMDKEKIQWILRSFIKKN